MSYIDECPNCGEIIPRTNHKCPPAWLVRNTDVARKYSSSH
jgi:hypothetical protein